MQFDAPLPVWWRKLFDAEPANAEELESADVFLHVVDTVRDLFHVAQHGLEQLVVGLRARLAATHYPGLHGGDHSGQQQMLGLYALDDALARGALVFAHPPNLPAQDERGLI